MNLATLRRSAMCSAVLLGSNALAQTPHNAPPWWGVQDDVTVSLYWSFDTGAGAPDSAVVPVWYNPAITAFTTSSNLTVIPTLAGHTGVLGITGTGGTQISASLQLKVDNDPHLNWVKIFWFQFDAYKTASGDLSKQIAQQLAKYGRAIVSEKSETLGAGWERVTINAQLIPQPDDEDIDWSFVENAFGNVAIDDLFVNSRCVKPGPDKDGAALGEVQGQEVPLQAAGGVAVQAAASTEPSATNPQRTYWVATRGPTLASPLQLLRIDATGGSAGAVISLPATSLQAPAGTTDLAVRTVQGAAGTVQQTVFALIDRRPTGGNVEILAYDADTGTPLPTTTLSGFPPIPTAQFGLAFDPDGETGAGTFWVSDPNGGIAYEFSRTQPSPPLDARPIPSGCVGLGYDETLGEFYGFSNTPQPTPSGPIQVSGYQWSGYDFALTGVEFCGDLTIQNPGGPRGGVARSLEVYRPQGNPTSELRMTCLVDAQGSQHLYEIAGPFGFGQSQLGRCGMRGGPPFLGSTTFEVTLTGVPHTLVALVHLGFSNTNYLGIPLPASLAFAGMPESYVSVSPDVPSPLLSPSAPGEFSLPVAIPNSSSLGYVPVFFQWVGLDSTVPGFIALSQAGKTVLYP